MRSAKGLILFAASALVLIASLGVYARSTREVLDARRELSAVMAANNFLKKTLGEMTVAIAVKDEQIDRLEQAGCDEQEEAPPRDPIGPNWRENKAQTRGESMRNSREVYF